MIQQVSKYFFYERPEQLFVGVELCARWYQLIKGDWSGAGANALASYAQQAQPFFRWVVAGRAFSEVGNQIIDKKWDAETVGGLADSLSQSAACADIVATTFFNFNIPRISVLGLAGDMVNGCVGLKGAENFNAAVGAVAALCSTLLSVGAYVRPGSFVWPQVSLICDTTVFIAGIVERCRKDP